MTEWNAALLGVMINRFEAIVEEMATIVVRAAYSAFVRETGDIGVVLISPHGEVFACPHLIAEKRLGLTLDPTLINGLSYEEGDIYISNDPCSTRGMSTHLPDLFVWRPLFAEGELVCFAMAFAHTSDIGGIVPGSISVSSVDRFQEGIIIPPVKLFSNGRLVEDVQNLIFTNTRIRDNNWGDVKALLGALETASRRINELVNSYGRKAVLDAEEQLLTLAESRARKLIEQIPDGTYRFSDYLDGTPDGQPVRIELSLTIKNDNVYLDFAGTDPQVRASLNVPTYEKHNHWQLMRAFPDHFRSVDLNIPWNDGLLRPIHVKIPKRTILNPTEDAASGNRVVTTWRVYYIIFGALAQAIPDLVPASGPGQAGVVLVSTESPLSGQRNVAVAEPLIGGGGARPMDDGFDATEFPGAHLRNIPVESLENELKVKVLGYGLCTGSGGLGRHRGGLGVDFSFEALSPYTTVTLRGSERHRFRSWGLKAGQPGNVGTVTIERKDGTRQPAQAFNSIVLQPGDRVHFASPGGGGYGDPLERCTDRILEDLKDGYVTPEDALEFYGIVMRDGEIDGAKTAKRRNQLREEEQNAKNTLYTLGPERLAYEAYMTDELHDWLLQLFRTLTIDQVQFLREKVGMEIRRSMEQSHSLSKAELRRLCVEWMGKATALPD